MNKLQKYDAAIKNLGCLNYLLLGIPADSSEFYVKFKPVLKTNFDVENEYITDPAQYPFTFEELVAEVQIVQADYEAKEYQRNRAAEYPDFRNYLDGVVKGDQAQIDAYIAACQAVKAKYPKVDE
jgi:hypothetical protein